MHLLRLTLQAFLSTGARTKGTLHGVELIGRTLTTAALRAELLQRFFPKGISRLWCPPLTHYDGNGAIDGRRISAHLTYLCRYTRVLLIPGSTGDGWELTPQERRQLLDMALELAPRLDFQVLIGTLHPDAAETLKLIRQDVAWLQSRFPSADVLTALSNARICGFTICAPRGKGLGQEQIGHALASVLDLGLPTAIYQLPQVTQNEIGPELAATLAGRYANFTFFKDTSGSDTIVRSGRNLGGVYTARGAEGGYADWLKPGGGPYEGFLLASANCFARQLQQMIDDISAGKLESARGLSRRLSSAVEEILRLAGAVPDGNAFANGMKAMDHYFAYGPRAAKVPPPRLHAGGHLPLELIRAAGKILEDGELLPNQGYLE